MALGLGSNLIVRDGGVPGVVVRLGKAFAQVTRGRCRHARLRRRGERHSGFLDRARCRHCRARIPPLDPRHGRRLRADERRGLWRRGQGNPRRLRRGAALGRSGDAAGCATCTTPIAIPNCPKVPSSLPRGFADEPASRRPSSPKWTAFPPAARPRSRCAARPAVRPSRTLQAQKAWELVDRAGCRGLTLGGAQVSEKHTNFLINTGAATSTEIEALGEEVRRRVRENLRSRAGMGNPARRHICRSARQQHSGQDMSSSETPCRGADGRLVVRTPGQPDVGRGRRQGA